MSARSIERIARGAWLVPPLLLTVVAATFLFLRRGPDQLFGYAFGALLGLAFLWVGISVFWPARADRRCPNCGEEALERLDQDTTRGLVCRACRWRDSTASSWFLAEEEGPLEQLVLRDRGRLESGPGARVSQEER
jgi:hypothetical protein